MMEGDDKLLDLDEAAAVLGLSRDWVGRACREGVLRHVTVGRGSIRERRRIWKSELERYIESKTREGKERATAYAETQKKRRAGLMPVPSKY